MKAAKDSLFDVVAHLQKTMPEVLELATARTESEFCHSFDCLLERSVRHLEENAEHYVELDEVGLSAVVRGCLNGAFGIRATQESHSNGHVDLVVEINLAEPIQRRLAEAKMEGGSARHQKGLGQLLTRYLTGREGTSWLLLYVRRPNIKGRMQALREQLDFDKPYRQTRKCEDHSQRWCFTSPHKHSSGEVVRVVHVGFNLHHPTPSC